jgi:hypothetical protein
MTMRYVILASAMLSMLTMRAQDSTWVHVSYTAYGCTWQMPGTPTMLDTLGVRMYSLELDSGMAIAVHFIEDVLPDTSMGSLYKAAFDVEGDTLRAMAQVMLAVSLGELLAIADTVVNGVPSLDLSFAVQEYEDAEPQLMHTRLYYWNRRFITFSVTAANRHASESALLAEGFRSTIHISAP